MDTLLFISNDSLPCDLKLFLQPEEGEKVEVFDKNTFTMSDMAVSAGVFSSKTQARKNGWEGSIPLGFGKKKAGKRWIFWFNSMDQILD